MPELEHNGTTKARKVRNSRSVTANTPCNVILGGGPTRSARATTRRAGALDVSSNHEAESCNEIGTMGRLSAVGLSPEAMLDNLSFFSRRAKYEQQLDERCPLMSRATTKPNPAMRSEQDSLSAVGSSPEAMRNKRSFFSFTDNPFPRHPST